MLNVIGPHFFPNSMMYLYPRHLCQGFIVFVFPLVHTYVRSYYRGVPSVALVEFRAKFYVKVSQVLYISPITHQKAFIFGPCVHWRTGFHSMTPDPRVHAGARVGLEVKI